MYNKWFKEHTKNMKAKKKKYSEGYKKKHFNDKTKIDTSI